MRKIKQYREAYGIRQIDMAEHFEVSQATIVNWESADGYPPSKVIPAIASFLGCSIADLYAGEPAEKEVG